MTPVFTAALFHYSQDMKQPMSINRWLDKEVALYTYSIIYIHWIKYNACWSMYTVIEFYSNKAKNEIHYYNNDRWTPDSIILREVSHTDKDKYCMLSFLWNFWKKWIYIAEKTELQT